MKKLIAIAALTLMCGSAAFAQNTGAPANAQSEMNKPGMNNMDKGSMNNNTTTGTSGMSTDTSKNNPSKEMSKDGSSSAGSKEMKK